MATRNTPPSRRRNGGFTLIEMLLVVAIIAVLIAVPIPAVSNALERSRCATDAANERAAKAYVLANWASGEYSAADDITYTDTGGSEHKQNGWAEYRYDAERGRAYKENEPSDSAKFIYGKCKDHRDMRVNVFVCCGCGRAFTCWKYKSSGMGSLDEYTSHGTDIFAAVTNVNTLRTTHEGTCSYFKAYKAQHGF